jgi:hypothetical protein
MDPATGRFYREALESDENWIEGESSAFETAMQTTVGIGVGLFRLAFGAGGKDVSLGDELGVGRAPRERWPAVY